MISWSDPPDEPAVKFTDEEWGEMTDAVDAHAERLDQVDGWDALRRRKALLAAFDRLAATRRRQLERAPSRPRDYP